MIKINKKIADLLFEEVGYDKLGILCSDGAAIGDCEFVIVQEKEDTYLAHISEFEQDGVLVRLKDEKAR